MSRNDQDDSRQFPRLPKEVQVELKALTYPLPTGPGEMAESRDISPTGIRCVSDALFEPGTLLTVDIHLTGWQRHKKGLSVRLDPSALRRPLSVVAEVIWTRKNDDDEGNEIGISFRNIADDDFDAIQKALKI